MSHEVPSLIVVDSREKFNRLILEVGKWSKTNFKMQKSKWFDDIYLDSVAPVLGIVEELGELADAISRRNAIPRYDAIGDTMIYMADFYHRAGYRQNAVCLFPQQIDWGRIPGYATTVTEAQIEAKRIFDVPVRPLEISILTGMLAHCILKSHQGIRGYDKMERRISSINRCMTDIIILLCQATGLDGEKALAFVMDTSWKTWDEVKQRNWNKNPDGQGV